MHFFDWLIVAVPLMVIFALALHMRRYLNSVADFMAGGRMAGRYLLCAAKSEMGAGAVAYVAMFEWFGRAGFTIPWWQQLSVPLGLMLAITGWVFYRYRQTRALTLAQFFEIRYSRKFRLFTGMLAVFAGLLNYGIIPVIGARFVVYFLGLPLTVNLGVLQVPTYLLLMFLFLGVCVFYTVTGGQLTIMLSDCLQGMFSQIFYVIIAVAVLVMFSWPDTKEMLLARPPGESIVNPFDSFSTNDFNIWYVLMGMFATVYGTMAWQNQAGFNAAAHTPHEARMGTILGGWRNFALSTVMILLAVAALTFLHHGGADSDVIRAAMDRIPDARTQGQMELPVGLAHILPVGIKGLFVACVLMGIFGGDGMHLHSWSSIFVQDVIVPLRKKPLTTRQHLALLRWSAVGVAIFVFIFGALFKQTEYVAMWFIVTMAIYIGGAGSCIIGGLYWSRGTTAGAWTGLLTGSVLSTGGILLRQPASVGFCRRVVEQLGAADSDAAQYLLAHLGPAFPLNGVQISFFAALTASAAYVIVSLLTCRQPHNMDQLLHRGQYAVEPEASNEPLTVKSPSAAPANKRFHIYNLVGIDEHFTRGDRWVALGIFCWSIFWFGVFIIGSALYLARPWSGEAWADYWLVVGIILPLLIAVATTIWFTIGCWSDLRKLYQRLAQKRVDDADNGTVSGGGGGAT
jgi:SSS family solute:Na+ symporter